MFFFYLSFFMYYTMFMQRQGRYYILILLWLLLTNNAKLDCKMYNNIKNCKTKINTVKYPVRVRSHRNYVFWRRAVKRYPCRKHKGRDDLFFVSYLLCYWHVHLIYAKLPIQWTKHIRKTSFIYSYICTLCEKHKKKWCVR